VNIIYIMDNTMNNNAFFKSNISKILRLTTYDQEKPSMSNMHTL
jgi:hypothetical protein